MNRMKEPKVLAIDDREHGLPPALFDDTFFTA